MATNHYLVITDGTTTATFADGSGGAVNYMVDLDGWAPAVARLRNSALGGRSPYDDVVEEMQINVKGTSAANALANLATLAGLLDQADRFYKGESVSPVVIKYSPKGATVSSTSDPLTALILGRAPGDESALGLPVHFDPSQSSYIINIRMRFIRHGLWTRKAISATITKKTSPSAGSCAWVVGAGANELLPQPAGLAIGASVSSASTVRGFLLIDNHSGSPNIQIINSSSGAGGNFTSVAETSKNSVSGSILRYTPTDTIFNGISSQTLNIILRERLIDIYVTTRSNSNTPTWTVYTSVTLGDISFKTPEKIINYNNALPQIIHLGTMALPYGTTAGTAGTFSFFAKASTASGTLDFDQFIFFARDRLSNSTVEFNTTATFSASEPLFIDTAPACQLTPRVGWGDTTPRLKYSNNYSGNTFILSGCNISEIYLYSPTGSYWRMSRDGTNCPLSFVDASMWRYPAHLIPE